MIQVEGQAGFVGGEDGEVFGDAGDDVAVVEDAGVGIVDGVEDVSGDNALTFGVAREGVGRGYVDHAGVDPAGLAFGVANEPPVFHEREGWIYAGGGRRWGCAGGDGLGNGCALEEVEGVVLLEAVETFGVAAGGDVKVDLVARGGFGYDGIFAAGFAESFEVVGCVLAGGELFFDPADFAAGSADFEEAALVIEDYELFAVLDLSGAVGDGGYAVAEEGLLGGDVDVFF